jgi:uncharacterized protein (DUF433 family)
LQKSSNDKKGAFCAPCFVPRVEPETALAGSKTRFGLNAVRTQPGGTSIASIPIEVAMFHAEKHLHRAIDGTLLVGESQIRIDEVVAAFREGRSIGKVREQYPSLKENELRAAIDYVTYDPDDVMPNYQVAGSYWRYHEL